MGRTRYDPATIYANNCCCGTITGNSRSYRSYLDAMLSSFPCGSHGPIHSSLDIRRAKVLASCASDNRRENGGYTGDNDARVRENSHYKQQGVDRRAESRAGDINSLPIVGRASFEV